MSITVELVREKETKRTVRYTEQGDDPQIGTLYVPKGTLEAMGPGQWPERISLTIASAEAAMVPPEQLRRAA